MEKHIPGFMVRVNYVQPSRDELMQRFSRHINPEFMCRRFDPIKLCRTASRESRDIVFEFVDLVLRPVRLTGNILNSMEKDGLRPALYEELLAFDAKYPDEKYRDPIVALGSEANVKGGRDVAYLWRDDGGGGTRLCDAWGYWRKNCRFLAVRK